MRSRVGLCFPDCLRLIVAGFRAYEIPVLNNPAFRAWRSRVDSSGLIQTICSQGTNHHGGWGGGRGGGGSPENPYLAPPLPSLPPSPHKTISFPFFNHLMELTCVYAPANLPSVQMNSPAPHTTLGIKLQQPRKAGLIFSEKLMLPATKEPISWKGPIDLQKGLYHHKYIYI